MRLKEKLVRSMEVGRLMLGAVAIYGGIAWWLTPSGAPASTFWWNVLRVFGWLMGGYFVIAGVFIAIMMWSGRKGGH